MTACRLCGDEHPESYGVGPGLTVLKEREEVASDYELTERLYTDAEKSRIVPENHPDAAYLLGVPGDRIPHDQAERLGLVGNLPVGPETLPAGEPLPGFETVAPEAPAVSDKAVKGPKASA